MRLPALLCPRANIHAGFSVCRVQSILRRIQTSGAFRLAKCALRANEGDGPRTGLAGMASQRRSQASTGRLGCADLVKNALQYINLCVLNGGASRGKGPLGFGPPQEFSGITFNFTCSRAEFRGFGLQLAYLCLK